MKIKNILKNKKSTFSFEISPPKTDTPLEESKPIIKELSSGKPDFISVTYGAGGGVKRNSPMIVQTIEKEYNITSLSHLTCIGASKKNIDGILNELKNFGIENILALRGDIPLESNNGESYFEHASDLSSYIKKNFDFCIGGACYPEKHPESKTLEEDIDNLKKKIDSGMEFLTTQLFFDNEIFYRFMDKINERSINIPILTGIMPITNAKQIKRICELSGNAMPKRFIEITEKFGNDSKAMEQAGIAYAIEQIIDLVVHGVKYVHLYTMNKPTTTLKIRNAINEII